MSGFTAESFVSKLSKLSDSQQSIQTLSHWVQYHKKACGESAATWAAECLRAPPARQLLFVYLANDIMQNSRRKGPEFTVAYGDRLQHIFPRVFAAAQPATQAKLMRLLAIWEERRVLSSNMLNDMRTSVGVDPAALAAIGPPPPISTSQPKPPPKPPPPPPPKQPEVDVIDEDDEYVPEPLFATPAAAVESLQSVASSSLAAAGGGVAGGGPMGGGIALADLLMTLDQGSLIDELQAEREADLDISALEDVEVSDPSMIEETKAKASEAIALLSSQRARLVEEMEARRQLILLLAGSVERQNEQCERLDGALKGCEAMLATARSAEQQLKESAEAMAAITGMAAEGL